MLMNGSQQGKAMPVLQSNAPSYGGYIDLSKYENGTTPLSNSYNGFAPPQGQRRRPEPSWPQMPPHKTTTYGKGQKVSEAQVRVAIDQVRHSALSAELKNQQVSLLRSQLADLHWQRYAGQQR
jgi:hypothetical protein